MADLNLEPLFNQKKREFNTMGAGSTRFEDDFLVCTNRAINVINRRADLETPIARINVKEDDVNLDYKYEDVLSDGISMFMVSAGQRPAKGFETILKDVSQRFSDGVDSIRYDIINKAQAADTDDESNFANLGGLG